MRQTLLCILVWSVGAASAGAEPLRIDRTAERMRVDGALSEWRGARFSELGSGDDASMRYALASTDDGLYLAAEVRDGKLVTGAEGDALVLTMAWPEGAGGSRTRALWLWPGESGKSAARAELRDGRASKRDARITVVEGPRSKGPGWVIEAFAPWAALGADALWEQGRASLSLRDVDGAGTKGAITRTTATETRAGALPRIALGEGQRDLLGSFAKAKQLTGVEPRYDLRADVAGDARPERVVVIDRYVLLYGPGVRGGESSLYFELPYGLGGGLERADLTDLTGDGRAELVARVRQQNGLGKRTLLLVLALADGGIAPLFSHELAKEVSGGLIENQLAIEPAKRADKQRAAPRITVTPGRSVGLDAQRYREAPAADAQPILLPWGEVTSRSFAWDGTRIALVDEQKRAAPPPGEPAKRAAQAPDSAAVDPPAADASGAALAAFKSKVGLPASARPARTLRANLLPGAKSEQIDLFGTQLVLTGPEVGEGRGYLTYGLPIETADDLRELRTVDLSGGAADELLLRIRQPLSGAAGVERELLMVLRGEAGGRIVRALVAEVARRQGAHAIENAVSLEKGQLVRQPGVAKGWSARSYPFTSEEIGGVERLLLPWSDAAVRYRDDRGALRAVASRSR